MNKHMSVLLDESIKGLNINKDGIYVDMTLGYGGHSSEILKQLDKGYLYCFDQDNEAINYSQMKLSTISNKFKIIKSNFKNIKAKLEEEKVYKVDGVLFDLGVSSPQLDEDERGFSYHSDARLDMRMNQEQELSAFEVINFYKGEELSRIIWEYGEERFAKAIAKNIVKVRSIKPIATTLDLVNTIKDVIPMKEKLKHHPARKTFQAIRIEVNDELNVFEEALDVACNMINVGGRICVITFHSLEDRICKKKFKRLSEIDRLVKGMPNISPDMMPNFKLITTKAITASDEEVDNNNRSRSAKLRIIERIK